MRGMKQNMFVGDRFKNNRGTWATVVDYKHSKAVTVRFEDAYQYEGVFSTTDIKKGKFRNPYDRTAYGVGFVGVGPEPVKIDGENNPTYNLWRGMFERCYTPIRRLAVSSYNDCTVNPIWHCFQDFAVWAKNQIGFDLDCRNLDKDILVKNNREYGPDTCCFVPAPVNMLFVRASARRGECPVGVYLAKGKYYSARCKDGNKEVHLGYYKTPQEAFLVYKDYKESVIKNIAEKYKSLIAAHTYEALLNYSVDITD